MKIEIQGHTFVLHAHKAVYWVEKKTLLIGDLHLGKVSHFRKEGFAIPVEAINTNFVKLDELLNEFDVERIIFLGDLFHSAYNTEWELFSFWRHSHAHINMLIVLGNHDILPAFLFEESNVRVFVEEYTEEDFVFAHHPSETSRNAFLFAGHIHPVFTLRGKGRQSLRVPCFLQDTHQMILPCFGVFTGGYEINRMPHEFIYVISGKEVLRVG